MVNILEVIGEKINGGSASVVSVNYIYLDGDTVVDKNGQPLVDFPRFVKAAVNGTLAVQSFNLDGVNYDSEVAYKLALIKAFEDQSLIVLYINVKGGKPVLAFYRHDAEDKAFVPMQIIHLP